MTVWPFKLGGSFTLASFHFRLREQTDVAVTIGAREFMRFMHMGLALPFKKWRTISLFNTSGPVGLGLLLSIEILASLLSIGTDRVKEPLYLGLCAGSSKSPRRILGL